MSPSHHEYIHETPFGQRWGGERFALTAEHLAALQAGKTIALDVRGQYAVFLKLGEGV